MIFTVQQIKTNYQMVWIAEKDNQSIATVISPFERGKIRIDIDYKDYGKQHLVCDPEDLSGGSSLSDRLSFRLFCDGAPAGAIVGKVKKVKGFLQSYPYREMQWQGNAYYLYEVGLGRAGLFLCIYKGDTLIAVAEKALTVINFRDQYTVYTLNPEHVVHIMPLLIQYDVTAHGNRTEIAMLSVKKKQVNTIQKELKAKLDSHFIEQVKALESK